MTGEREITRWFTKANKVLTLFTILFIFASVFVPLFQMAEKHSLENSIRMSEDRVVMLEDRTRVLESEIASAKSPEALINRSVIRSVTYEEIDSSSIVLAKGDAV
ncbi:MAG: hypothetical protein ACI4NM_09215 [Bullifex sp.]